MVKFLYLAENLGSYGSPNVAIGQVMHQSGHNVGNFAFWNATRLLLEGVPVCVPFGIKAAKVPEDIDIVVIPAANFLNETSDLGWLGDLIATLDKPCIVVGLGAQSEREQVKPVLKPGTVHFLKEAAARTPFIGVRGPFTQALCTDHGVTNTRVLGCPSLFTNPDRRLAQVVASHWDRDFEKVAVHAASIKAHVMHAERYLFALLSILRGSTYILQRPVELMMLGAGLALNEKEQAYAEKTAAFLAPELSFGDFSRMLRSAAYVPYSVDSWRFFLRSHSHSLGTRIHGAMMSLAAYLPTVCITHDTRTRELCSVMKVPSIPCAEFKNSLSIKEVFARVSFDAEEFEENRTQLAAHYFELLSALGVRPSAYMKQNFS